MSDAPVVDPEDIGAVEPEQLQPVVPAPASILEDVTALVNTPEGQTVESDVLSGLPKKVRGTIYSVGGGLAALASGVVSYALVNPDALPTWAIAAASIVAPVLAAFTGGTAWASLGKK